MSCLSSWVAESPKWSFSHNCCNPIEVRDPDDVNLQLLNRVRSCSSGLVFDLRAMAWELIHLKNARKKKYSYIQLFIISKERKKKKNKINKKKVECVKNSVKQKWCLGMQQVESDISDRKSERSSGNTGEWCDNWVTKWRKVSCRLMWIRDSKSDLGDSEWPWTWV